MPRKKKICSLLDLSVRAVAKLVKVEALRVAKYVVTHFVYDEIEVSEFE